MTASTPAKKLVPEHKDYELYLLLMLFSDLSVLSQKFKPLRPKS